MFTKQHYKAIAAIIAGNTLRRIYNGKPFTPYVQKAGLVVSLADYFKSDNLRFDRQKFLEACDFGQPTQISTNLAEQIPEPTISKNLI